MTPESSRFGMTPTFQESMQKDKAKKSKAESQTLEAEMEERLGPKVFTREQFGRSSGEWLEKLNGAKAELMNEITRRAYHEGGDVTELEAQAAILNQWTDRVWALALENAHQGMTDPKGTITLDENLFHVIEGNPLEAARSQVTFPTRLEASAKGLETVEKERDRSFLSQLEASQRGLEAGIAERKAEMKARQDREHQMSREIAEMRETMDTLEDRMRVIQDMRKDIDEHEDALIESGDFAAEKLTAIDIEREEMQKLHSRFFDEITKVMRNFDKLLERYEEVQADNPFSKAA